MQAALGEAESKGNAAEARAQAEAAKVLEMSEIIEQLRKDVEESTNPNPDPDPVKHEDFF